MKIRLRFFRELLALGFFFATGWFVHAQPALTIKSAGAQLVQVAWPSSAIGFSLQQSISLGTAANWRVVPLTPVLASDQWTLSLSISGEVGFFRLGTTPLLRIQQTSPLDGETGVAVTRETIVHFTAPLSKTAVVGTNNFYAGSGGRRILSRVELSSDRTKATLFYLEPMPGSTRINAVLDGTGLTDELGRPVDVDGDGVAGGFAIIAFDTLNLTPLPGTAVFGRVFASELMPGSDTGTNAVNRPLEGVTITVDGKEQDLRAVTDAQGNFTLSPAPPGRFFVKIDGRTAKGSQWPKGAYYPYVGKAWEAVAGRTNNLAGGTGEIFLPLISADTLQPVSMTNDTTISFPPSVIASNPALEGVSLTVPANSLFSDIGARGGKVGIAPVPPDRLPGPLPPGADLPLVITVQTDGALNFDKPVPACFPNLPNSTTGKPWPPGTKGSLISFNHKKGVWEDVGGMTVSPDGRFFCTDPGVGILQPGWHGPQCPKPKNPPPPPPNPPDPPCKPDPLALQKCFDGCAAESDKCQVIAALIIINSRTICEAARSTRGNKFANTCLKDAQKQYKKRLDQCLVQQVACVRGCIECNSNDTPTPKTIQRPTAHAVLGTLAVVGGSDAIKDQILQDVNSIDGLLAPYLDSDTDLPQQVVTQIDDLFAHANAIAGGDSGHFLENYEIESERANVALLENDLVPNRGNAPAYPVLFAAEVERNGETVVFRGETEPFGQYLVFVPPDGELQSVSFYDPQTKQYGQIIPNFRPEAPFALPRFTLSPLPADAPDSDHDGLPDVVEAIYGTDPSKADTDGDGISDGAEIEAGTDPLGGLIAQNGVIATVKTPGAALDIATGNGLIATAEGTSGVSIFNPYTGENPTILAHLPMPGNAQRIAIDGKFIAVAAGDSGLQIVDSAAPANATVIHQVTLVGAVAVAAAGGTAFVGATDGSIASVDLASGHIVDQSSVPVAVQDLAIGGDYLYALTFDRIYAISFANGTLSLAGSALSPSVGQNFRLFVGGGLAYVVHRNGYNTFDLTDPANPVLIKAGSSGQFGWKQMTVTGSGLALAAVGPNSPEGDPHDISLYDVSSPTNAVTVITTFPTPGLAQAAALWDGLAYVADGSAGLQVVNYLAYDSKGVAPKVTLSANFPLTNAQVVEGVHARVAANAIDDVQVRNVEFYLDGNLAEKDGSFPFEFRFITPQRATDKTSFTLRAKATDTGGNFTWSDEITVSLLPDTTPPEVTRILPRPIAAGIRSVSVSFNEEIDPASLTSAALKLFASGPDGLAGTADDVELLGGTRTISADRTSATLSFPDKLPLGAYRVVVGRDFTDRRANHLPAEAIRDFKIIDAIYWINPGSGDWSNPQNWNVGRLPGPADDVLISTVDAATITYSHGNNAIHSLLNENSFVFSGGRLEIAQTMQMNKFELSGGTLASARIVESDIGGAELRLRSGTLDGVTLDTDVTLQNGDQIRTINGLTVNRTLTLGSKDSYTGINFQGGTQTLGGTGQVVFGGTGNYNFLQSDAALTIGPGLKVHGVAGTAYGTMGQANIPLINQGTISADVAGQTVVIRGQPFFNSGTLESKNGGILTLTGGWTNTGVFKITDSIFNLGGNFTTAGIGNIQRSGGTVNLQGVLNNTNAIFAINGNTGPIVLNGGTIQGGSITTADGATLRLQSGILDGVTLDTDVTLQNGDQIRTINGLTVNRTLTLGSIDSYTGINFQGGAQTLGGTGQVVFGGTGNYNFLQSDAALTIGPGLKVHGVAGTAYGTMGQANIPLINQGTISADVAGQTVVIRGQPFFNSGTLESKNGGILTLTGGWTNTGVFKITDSIFNLGGNFTTAGIGNIQRSGGTVNLQGVLNNTNAIFAINGNTGPIVLNGGTIQGGSITTADGATLRLQSGILDGVTLDTDVTLQNGDQIRTINGLTVNRTLTLGSKDSYTGINFQGGTQTLGGTGQVVFGGTGNYNFLQSDAALTIGPGLKVHGVAGTAYGTMGQANIPLINQGTISADVAGQTVVIRGQPFFNSGTLESKNGGILTLTGGWTNTGVFKITDSIFNLGGNFTTAGIGNIQRSGGTVNLQGVLNNTNAIFAINGNTGPIVLNGGTIQGGSITTADGATLRLQSGILDGVTLDTDVTLQNGDQIRTINGLTVNRTLTLGSIDSYTGINFQGGAQTLGGTGQVVFGGTGNYNFLQSDAALTIGPGLKVHGVAGTAYGTMGQANIPLINQGTISADVAGQTVVIRGQPFFNSGTLESKNGGILTLTGGWTNTGVFKITDSIFNLGGNFTTAGIGNIQRSGGTVNLQGVLNNTNAIFAINGNTGPIVLNGGTIQGGSITTADGATLRLQSGILDGVTLDTDVTLQNGDQIRTINGLTVNRTLTLGSIDSYTGINFQGGAQTLGGTGQVVFGGTGNYNFLQSDAALTIGPGLKVHGVAGTAYGTMGQANIPLINQGTISADVAGQTVVIRGQPFFNSGTLESKNGGILTLTGGWTNTGVFKITDSIFNLGGNFTTAGIGNIQRSGGTVNLQGVLNNTNAIFAINGNTGPIVLNGGTIQGGSITTADGATLRLQSGILDGVTLDTDVTLQNGDQIRTINGLTVNRTLTLGSIDSYTGINFQGGAQTLGGTGQVVFGGTGNYNFLQSDAALTIGPGLKVHGSNGSVGQANAPLINFGVISADVAGGTIYVSGSPFTNNGTTNQANGGKLVIR